MCIVFLHRGVSSVLLSYPNTVAFNSDCGVPRTDAVWLLAGRIYVSSATRRIERKKNSVFGRLICTRRKRNCN
jgi:hypothetical protein